MKSPKIVFVCQECGAQAPKWMGRCADCGAWNSLVEERAADPAAPAVGHRYAQLGTPGTAKLYAEVEAAHSERLSTGIDEFDRVLGGGIVPGSLVLLGGEPGIGKSTLLLQAAAHFARAHGPVLYASGEESEHQVKSRGDRLGVGQAPLYLLSETCIERILEEIARLKPSLVIIDSVQTVWSAKFHSAPGSVGQVREAATQFLFAAKGQNVPTMLVGHVTKDGSLAGPKVLEHVVDTVLSFEGERHHSHRVVRAVKNRFGAVNELGVFAMTDRGLKEVSNPSAIFLTRAQEEVPGSVVMATWEGTRPMLVEVQALVDDSHLANPRRVTLGLDQNRLAMLLAVLHRHGGIPTHDQDVFLNVVGGVKVLETASDLALMAAVMSSLRNRPLPHDLLVFGEVGLSGEVRPVPSGQERLKEAAKHGFKRAIVPKGNAPKESPPGIQIIGVTRLEQALDALFE